MLLLLGPALVRDESFVYRDAAHFYYPLLEWTSREWGAGRVPLWNPQENCGLPVLGDATSSVFYPGKLIFAVPWLAFATRYKLYVVGHVALAAFAAYHVARRWGASPPAAAACAVSYACGGNVLFQIYNVVYLVGAAWLPLAFLAAERMLTQRSARHAVLFGAALALMTLGGDPQTAYHAGLLAALYAVILALVRRPSQAASEKEKETAWKGHPAQTSFPRLTFVLRQFGTNSLTLLGLATLVGGLLAAVQIMPSLEWNRASDRAAYNRPRNIFEAWEYLDPYGVKAGQKTSNDASVFDAIAQGLAGVPEEGTHHESIYDFSVGPWRLAEMLWPNFSGRPFPENRRWIAAIGAEGRPWTPSLYAGLLPLLLGLASLRLWGGTACQRWLTWTALVAVIASLGWYGLGWLTLEISAPLFGADAKGFPIGAPTGGLYWFFVVALPGYAQFRYPAKWLVPAALALSLLAARGWDRAFEKRPAGLRLALVICGAISACGVLLALALRPFWAELLAAAPDDEYFGPLDLAGSASDLQFAFAQTTVLCGVFWWLLGRAGGEYCVRWSWAAVVLTAAELALAQGGLIATAPRDVWMTPSPFASHIARQDSLDGVSHYRVFRASPDGWPLPKPRPEKTLHRQTANARWERQTLYPKYHLLEENPRVSLVESSTTMESHDLALFLRIAREQGLKRPEGTPEPHLRTLSALSAKYLILPSGFSYPNSNRLIEHQGAVLWHNPRAAPRAWIVHRAVEVEPPSVRDVETTTDQVVQRLRLNTPRRLAILESSSPASFLPPPAAALAFERADSPGESCVIARDEPQRVEIEATLALPGVLILGDLYYPGWVAEVRDEDTGKTTPLEIVRTNRILRGVFLPPGQHHITFRYRPVCFYAGATVSALAWSALAIAAAANGFRRAGCLGITLIGCLRRWRR